MSSERRRGTLHCCRSPRLGWDRIMACGRTTATIAPEDEWDFPYWFQTRSGLDYMCQECLDSEWYGVYLLTTVATT